MFRIELTLLENKKCYPTSEYTLDNYSSTYVSNFDVAELQSSRSWLCT